MTDEYSVGQWTAPTPVQPAGPMVQAVDQWGRPVFNPNGSPLLVPANMVQAGAPYAQGAPSPWMPQVGIAVPVTQTVVVNNHAAVSARRAHGAAYWILVGWWWGPAKWLGRVLLWLFFFPLGIWRSIRHSQRKTELKALRGQQK
jgi:hypothetical protein